MSKIKNAIYIKQKQTKNIDPLYSVRESALLSVKFLNIENKVKQYRF